MVCFDQYPDSELFFMADCPVGLAHAMCRDCASHHFTLKVTEHKLKGLKCPLFGSDGCQALLGEKELKSIVTAAVFAKFERFAKTDQDPNLRECPNAACGVLVEPTYKEGGVVVPEMKCGSCGQVFCFYHSTAHDGEDCEAYAKAQALEEERVLNLSAFKPCPACGLATVKSEGCNHLVCPTCQTQWCWVW